MALALNILEIILAALLVTCVLLQQKGSGLGSAFGGAGVIYSTKRGIEKIIFRATIVLAVLFFLTILVHVLFV